MCTVKMPIVSHRSDCVWRGDVTELLLGYPSTSRVKKHECEHVNSHNTKLCSPLVNCFCSSITPPWLQQIAPLYLVLKLGQTFFWFLGCLSQNNEEQELYSVSLIHQNLKKDEEKETKRASHTINEHLWIRNTERRPKKGFGIKLLILGYEMPPFY